jgi:hypothetical protein
LASGRIEENGSIIPEKRVYPISQPIKPTQYANP